jgi:hypothetical protein
LVARGAELLNRERKGASEVSGIGAWTYRGDAALQHLKTVTVAGCEENDKASVAMTIHQDAGAYGCHVAVRNEGMIGPN